MWFFGLVSISFFFFFFFFFGGGGVAYRENEYTQNWLLAFQSKLTPPASLRGLQLVGGLDEVSLVEVSFVPGWSWEGVKSSVTVCCREGLYNCGWWWWWWWWWWCWSWSVTVGRGFLICEQSKAFR